MIAVRIVLSYALFCQAHSVGQSRFAEIESDNEKGKACCRAKAGAYLGFSCIKRLGVFLLSPGWDVSPSQG